MDQAALALANLHDSTHEIRTIKLRCNECELCMKPDCGRCVSCRDKIIFGGPGVRKKPCDRREPCDYPVLKHFSTKRTKSCIAGTAAARFKRIKPVAQSNQHGASTSDVRLLLSLTTTDTVFTNSSSVSSDSRILPPKLSPDEQKTAYGSYYCFWCNRGPYNFSDSLRKHCRKKHRSKLFEADREARVYWSHR